MAKLESVEGIGITYAGKLAAIGITTTDKLLKEGSTAHGRHELEEATGISGKLILEWVNNVDLFRIKGVAEEYADLLEEAGVDTIPELAQRNADHLHQKLVEINEAKKLVRRLPTPNMVKDWVAQAKNMPRIIEY